MIWWYCLIAFLNILHPSHHPHLISCTYICTAAQQCDNYTPNSGLYCNWRRRTYLWMCLQDKYSGLHKFRDCILLLFFSCQFWVSKWPQTSQSAVRYIFSYTGTIASPTQMPIELKAPQGMRFDMLIWSIFMIKNIYFRVKIQGGDRSWKECPCVLQVYDPLLPPAKGLQCYAGYCW